MINITICDTTPTKELASATKALNELYNARRSKVIDEVVAFLKSHPSEAYTAREISNSCGLPIRTIVGVFNNDNRIDSRDRWTTRTFYALNEDGTPNLDDKVEHRSKVNEYFYQERRGW